MPLPQHLRPKTYWEKRADLMEESTWRLAIIMVEALPPQYGALVSDHLREWNDMLDKLREEHPANGAEAKGQ
ncbi:hypothetical protein [Candidatus Accumulibacter vicinus]|uniref:Uncharacterized protein n=1 Tax=Candidatus Accumulibacter vicinus TaxID=2954382 RepID=A0A084Y2F8_9PROT|nr:hypothetical protein [Candidatus Accumulibacter vicinus]KFB68902.1 MAG: hypothetical protein CAPSK01_001757 [Candidatus Accumulibacter vicinus]